MEETRLLIDFLVLKEKLKTFFERKEINYHLNTRHYGSAKAWIFLNKKLLKPKTSYCGNNLINRSCYC